MQQVIKRHRSELISDGYKVISNNDLENVHEIHFKIPNRGLAIFPRRAILRLGMVLRDSPIARLVRSYLLNTEEISTLPTPKQDTLRHMVQQLGQQATQLIENADELRSHAEQLKSQSRMIAAIVDQIYLNRGQIGDLRDEIGENRNRIIALENSSKKKISLQLEIEHITQEQINILKRRVKEKGNPCRIWSKLKTHFNITRYIYLPKDKFREALDWLENYRS